MIPEEKKAKKILETVAKAEELVSNLNDIPAPMAADILASWRSMRKTLLEAVNWGPRDMRLIWEEIHESLGYDWRDRADLHEAKMEAGNHGSADSGL